MPNDAPILGIVQRRVSIVLGPELWQTGQLRDRTADLADFSRVPVIRHRPGSYACVASALLSRDEDGLAIGVDPGPYGRVRIALAQRRQNRRPSARDGSAAGYRLGLRSVRVTAAPVARCACFRRLTPRPRAFTRGRAERHRSRACPQQTRHPRPAHTPWEGRSMARALDLERANAAPHRYVEVTTLAAPLVTTGRSPARGHRSAGRQSSAERPVGTSSAFLPSSLTHAPRGESGPRVWGRPAGAERRQNRNARRKAWRGLASWVTGSSPGV
jgi:hypothetical protein